jgi:hypothetical protein
VGVPLMSISQLTIRHIGYLASEFAVGLTAATLSPLALTLPVLGHIFSALQVGKGAICFSLAGRKVLLFGHCAVSVRRVGLRFWTYESQSVERFIGAPLTRRQMRSGK